MESCLQVVGKMTDKARESRKEWRRFPIFSVYDVIGIPRLPFTGMEFLTERQKQRARADVYDFSFISSTLNLRFIFPSQDFESTYSPPNLRERTWADGLREAKSIAVWALSIIDLMSVQHFLYSSYNNLYPI